MPKNLDSTYDLVANTYTAKEQSFAVCEVGDAKQPDAFYPQVKIMRWDNECNFSARLVHEEANPEVSLVDDKIQWVGDAVEAHFYEVGAGKEGGGYEFEIILQEPPRSNIISMTLQTKGLDFFYQPELTQEEIAHGATRPDKAVGSYAVYHQTMAGDFTALGGKNYLAGKAFHIYRPRIEDAKGKWVWGVLNIDEKAGLLTVTIPQDFLDKAVYPVRHAAGLEFGYHAIGASGDSQSDWIRTLTKSLSGIGTPSLPGSSGTLNSLSVYARTAGCSFAPAIYNDNGSGLPGTKLASAETGTALGAAWAWVTTALSSSIVGNTQYWLGFNLVGGWGEHKWDTNNANCSSHLGAGSWPSTWPNALDSTAIYSIYATYTAAGAAGQATAKRFGGVPDMAVNKGVW